MGDCPRKYLEFVDQEDKFKKEYEEDGCDMVRMENGELVYSWDERFYTGPFVNRVKYIPEHLTLLTIKHRDRYGSFEEFVSDWHGKEGRDEEKGRYGYWENPNKKWDWYMEGGRW